MWCWQEAKQKAEAAEKAREEEEKQKAAEASKRDAAEAERLRTIEEAKAKDRAVLEVRLMLLVSPVSIDIAHKSSKPGVASC